MMTTHTHTHTHTRTHAHTHKHTHTHTRTQRGREGGKQQIDHDHSYAENGVHALSSHIALNAKGELYN